MPHTITLIPIIHRTQERMLLQCPNDKALNRVIRQQPGVRWSQTHYCWHLPCTNEAYKGLLEQIKGLATVDNKALKQYLIKRKMAENIRPEIKKNTALFFAQKMSKENLALLNRTSEYLKLKAYSPATIKTYSNEIIIFLKTIGRRRAESLQTDDVRRYILKCIEKDKLSENTIHSRLNALKLMYEQVLGREKFFVEIPRPKTPLTLPRVLGEKELLRLFKAAPNIKHKAILFVAYSAGLRVSEVINLRWQDIDRERQQIFVHCSKGKKDRYVPLSILVTDILEQYYRLWPQKPKHYVFEGQGGGPYSMRSAQQIFSACKMKAGISKKISFHGLRHSYATHMLEKGIDSRVIKDLLGHFNIKTTERYLHVRKEFLINISSPLDDLYKKSFNR